MRIKKGVTPNFEDYEVAQELTYLPSRWALPWTKDSVFWSPVSSVIEADDDTGLIIHQVVTTKGEPVFSNGKEDIYLENAVILLLLVPPIKDAFLKSGFKPKTVQRFAKIKITSKRPPAPPAPVESDRPSDDKLALDERRR